MIVGLSLSIRVALLLNKIMDRLLYLLIVRFVTHLIQTIEHDQTVTAIEPVFNLIGNRLSGFNAFRPQLTLYIIREKGEQRALPLCFRCLHLLICWIEIVGVLFDK